MKKSLTDTERLKKKSDLQRVFTSRKKTACTGARLLFVPNGLQYNRVVIAPVRKFGRAVDRNRVRRIIREIYRTSKHELVAGFDLAFIMYPGRYSFEERREQVLSLLEKAGILIKDNENSH